MTPSFLCLFFCMFCLQISTIYFYKIYDTTTLRSKIPSQSIFFEPKYFLILFNFPYFVNVIRNYSVPVFSHFIVFPWLLTSSSSINSNNLYYFQTNDAILTVSFFSNGNLLIIVNTMIFYGTEVQEYLIICVLDLPWKRFCIMSSYKGVWDRNV